MTESPKEQTERACIDPNAERWRRDFDVYRAMCPTDVHDANLFRWAWRDGWNAALSVSEQEGERLQAEVERLKSENERLNDAMEYSDATIREYIEQDECV